MAFKYNDLLRTYEKARLYGNEISNNTKELAYFHPAVITTDSGYQVLASCVTFAPPYEVPPGSSHRVFAVLVLISNKLIELIISQNKMGLYLNSIQEGSGGNRVVLYVHNRNQGIVYTCS